MTASQVAALVRRMRRREAASLRLAHGERGAHLLAAVADGRAARDELVAAHMHLVENCVRRYAARVDDYWLPDLAQEGYLGLRRATGTFEPGRGGFPMYARYWVHHFVCCFLTKYLRVLPLPAAVVGQVRRLQRARDRLRARRGRLGSVERAVLADELGVSEARLDLLEQAEREPASLEAMAAEANDDGGSDAAARALPGSPEPGPFEVAAQNELRQQVQRMLAALDPRQRDVVRLRFGFEDGRVHTLDEVSRIFGITRERVRQLEVRALARLAHPKWTRRLACHLDGDRLVELAAQTWLLWPIRALEVEDVARLAAALRRRPEARAKAGSSTAPAAADAAPLAHPGRIPAPQPTAGAAAGRCAAKTCSRRARAIGLVS